MSSTPHPSNLNPQEYEPREESVNIDELDCPFTNAEIIKTLTTLKRHKSPDMNDNVADFFIDSKDFIAPYICNLFNHVYKSGVYPEQGLHSPNF